jgi:hypothetical protein
MQGARVHAKQFDINHQRQPGERVPACAGNASKRPDNTAKINTAANVRVVNHVKRIVVAHEVEVVDGPEDGGGQSD